MESSYTNNPIFVSFKIQTIVGLVNKQNLQNIPVV